MSRTTRVAIGLTALAAAAFAGSHTLITRPGVAGGARAGALLGAVACNATGLVALACAAVYWTRGERVHGWLREDLGLVAARASGAHLFVFALGTVALSLLIDALVAATAPAPSASIEATRRAAGTLATRESGHTLAAIVALAGGALAPAIGEELFFRGWMLRAVRATWGDAAAIGVTSALFGWMHGDWLHAGGGRRTRRLPRRGGDRDAQRGARDRVPRGEQRVRHRLRCRLAGRHPGPAARSSPAGRSRSSRPGHSST